MFSQILNLSGNAVGCTERPHKAERQAERQFQSNPWLCLPARLKVLIPLCAAGMEIASFPCENVGAMTILYCAVPVQDFLFLELLGTE